MNPKRESSNLLQARTKKIARDLDSFKCSAWSNGEQWWNSSAHSPEHFGRMGRVQLQQL